MTSKWHSGCTQRMTPLLDLVGEVVLNRLDGIDERLALLANIDVKDVVGRDDPVGTAGHVGARSLLV